MFCPKCELEIKGEDKRECPICGEPLQESPFSLEADGVAMPEDDPELQSIIADIDQKVQRNLDADSSADTAEFTLEGLGLTPAEEEFEFSAEADQVAQNVQEDTDAEQVFSLDALDMPADAAGSAPPDYLPDMPELESAVVLEPELARSRTPDTPEPELGIAEEPPLKFEQPAPLAEPEWDIADEARPEAEQPEPEVELPLETAAQVQPEASPPSAAVSTEPPPDDAEAVFDLEQQLSGNEAKSEPGTDLAAELDRIVVPAGQADSAAASPADTCDQVDAQQTAEILDQAISQLGDSMPADTATGSRSRVALLIFLCLCLAGAAWYAYRTLRDAGPAPAGAPPVTRPAVVTQPEPAVAQDPVTAAVEDIASTVAEEEPAEAAEALSEAEQVVPAAAAEAAPEAEQVMPAAAAEAVPDAEQVMPAAAAEAVPDAEAVVPVAVALPEAPYYAIHAGSYRDRTVAQQEARRLTDMNFIAYLERADLGSRGVWYRVKVGHCDDRGAAEQLQSQLKTADGRLRTRIVYHK